MKTQTIELNMRVERIEIKQVEANVVDWVFTGSDGEMLVINIRGGLALPPLDQIKIRFTDPVGATGEVEITPLGFSDPVHLEFYPRRRVRVSL